jgi:hypothetical protein
MTYSNRNGPAVLEPSAGVVSRPVHGAGKLSIGWHDLEVMSLAEFPTHWVVLLGNPANHVHSELVSDRPPTWLQTGARVRGRVGLGAGFVVVRDVDRYQARDSVTKAPLSGWTTDLAQLYADALSVGSRPATTELKEVTGAGHPPWTPVLHAGPDRPAR